MAPKTYIKTCFIVILFNYIDCGEILCEPGFCRDYLFDPGCPVTSSVCDINNSTHAGLTLLSPTICNCCDFCLPLFLEGSHCSLGGPGDGVTVGRCGDGLTCIQEEDGNFCRRSNIYIEPVA